jgi:hypothetical protein
MLMCFLYILKNFNRDALRLHWSQEGIPAGLFSTLSLSAEVFAYRGRKDTIARCLESTRVKHQDAVR